MNADVPLASQTPPGSKRAYWACQLGYWGVFGIGLLSSASSAASLVPTGMQWSRVAVELVAFVGAMLVLTHLLRSFMRRHRWDALSVWALAPRILLTSLILGAPLGAAWHFTAVGAVSASDPLVDILGVSPLQLLLGHAANWSAWIGAWTVLYFVVLGARKRRFAELRQSEMARALQQAELRLLKSQLNPHFLFNSLNSVRALIADDPKRARHAVTQLARTLRYTLDSGQGELVTLDQELEIVDDYLGLESLRLGERLRIERDIPPNALRARIPVMLLQTVVENAVKHGLAELPAGGVLRISAQVADGELRLQVDNTRPAAPSRPANEGVGLRNAAERLRLLFGSDASLDLDLSHPERAVARLRIPVSKGLFSHG